MCLKSMSDLLPLLVANHKANKSYSDFLNWMNIVGPSVSSFDGTVVVCPSAPFLGSAFEKVENNSWKFKVGIQDISQFDQGAYTGEVAASQIKDICSYCIIGHSERRKYFDEGEDLLGKKVEMLGKSGIETIFCVGDENVQIPEGVRFVAYEPSFAIGTGMADTPQNAKEVAKKIKQRGSYTVIYGGSVTYSNVSSFLESGLIEGVLVGSASLDAQEFSSILKNI